MGRYFLGSDQRRTSLLGASVALASVLACPSVVRALDAETFLVHGWGDFVAKPQLQLSGTYSDNLFYGNNAPEYATLGRRKESDLITTVSPGIRLQYGEAERNQIIFDYYHDEILYADLEEGRDNVGNPLKHSDFNYNQNRLDLRTKFETGRLRINGTDSIQFLSGFLGGGYTVGLRTIERTLFSDVYRFDFQVGAKTDLYSILRHETFDYSNGSPIYDQTSLTGTFGSTYHFSEKVGAFVEGFYGQTETSPNILNNAQFPEAPRSEVLGGYVGLRGDFTPKLTGSTKFGFEHRGYSGGGPSSDAPTIDVTLTYSPTPKTTGSLTYLRRTGVSFLFAEQNYTFDVASFELTQWIGTTGLWRASLSASYNRGSYADTRVGAIIIPERLDNSLSARFRLGYRISSWAEVSLAYEFERFDSDGVYFVEGFNSTGEPAKLGPLVYLVDYDNHRITLQLSIGY